MKSKIPGLLAVGLPVAPISAQAGVITRASSATASSSFAPHTPAAATNQSGLNSNYVSGVTGFDAFVATGTHADINIAAGAKGWFNDGSSMTATFTMDLAPASCFSAWRCGRT